MLKRKFREAIDWIFGFDFFISYAHKDGTGYPSRLTASLAKLRLDAFLDKTIYSAGDDLSVETQRRVRMSQSLVVVCGPEALKSTWVTREVEVALDAGRRIVVIDVKGAFESAPADLPLRVLLENHIRIREFLGDTDVGPSPGTVEQIEMSFRSMKQLTRRIIAFAVSVAVFVVVVGVAGLLFHRSIGDAASIARSQSTQALVNGETAAREQGVRAAAAHFAYSLKIDPTHDAAVDRLQSLIALHQPPWRIMRRETFGRPISTSQISANGQVVAAALDDGSIVTRSWRNARRELLPATAPMELRESDIEQRTRLAISRDGQVLAAICVDGVLRVWDTSSGSLLKEKKDSGLLTAVAVSPNGKFVAAGRGTRSALLTHIGSAVEAPEPGAFEREITSDIEFVDDETVLVTRTTSVDRWQVHQGKSTHAFSRSELSDPEDETSHKYHGFKISPDGRWQAWIEHDYGDFQAVQMPLVFVLMETSGKPSEQMESWGRPSSFGDNVVVNQVSFDPTSTHLAIVTKNVLIARRDAAPFEIETSAQWAGFDPGGSIVFTTSINDTSLWSLKDGSPVSAPLPAGGDEGSVFVIKGDGSLQAIVTGEKEITWWSHRIVDESAGELEREYAAGIGRLADPFNWKSRSKLSRHGAILREAEPGEWVVESGSNGAGPRAVKIQFPISEETARKLEQRGENERLREEARNDTFNADSLYRDEELESLDPQTDAAISEDGKTIVTIAGERDPAVWRTGSPNYLRLLQGDGKRYALNVALSENGNRALVLYAGSYMIFDVDHGTALADHELDGTLMDVSADLSQLLVQGKDSTFETVDAIRSQRIGLLLKLPSGACSAALSPTGRQIALGSSGGIVTIYDASSGLAVSEPIADGTSTRTTCATPLFDESGQYIFVIANDPASVDKARRLVKIKADASLTEEEARTLAGLAEELIGSRISPVGLVETFEVTPVEDLRAKYLKPEQPGLTEILSEVLWAPTPPGP